LCRAMICKNFLCGFLNISKTTLSFLDTLDERLDDVHVISILLQPTSSIPPAQIPTPSPHPPPPSDLLPAVPSANIRRGRACKTQLHARPCGSIQHHFSFSVAVQLQHQHSVGRSGLAPI